MMDDIQERNEEKGPVFAAVPFGSKEEAEQFEKHMQWLVDVLKTEVRQVEEDRVYVSGRLFGKSRYHLMDKLFNGGIQVEQIEVDEKWSKRVNFEPDEIPQVLKVLLEWCFARKKQEEEAKARAGQEGESLDDHPF